MSFARVLETARSLASASQLLLATAWPIAVALSSSLSLPGQPAPSRRQWSQPQPGWLYVLDWIDGHKESRVWLVDPIAGQVTGQIAIGPEPDMALSPDGARLFVSFKDTGTFVQRFAVIDTATAETLQVFDNPDGLGWHGPVPVPLMVVSAGGDRVYVFKRHSTPPDRDEYYVATFDTKTGTFLPERAVLGKCRGAVLLPLGPNRLLVSCGAENEVHLLQLSDRGNTVSDRSLRASPLNRDAVRRHPNVLSHAIADPAGRNVYVVLHDGRLIRVDAVTEVASQPRADSLLVDRWVPFRMTAVSPDGRRLYVPVHLPANYSFKSDQIIVLDTTSADITASVTPSRGFENLALSLDGRSLYASVPESGALMVIDTQTMRETGTIAVGTNPSLIAVAPYARTSRSSRLTPEKADRR